MVHWVKQGQCDRKILGLESVIYFRFLTRISGYTCKISNRFSLFFVDMVTIS